MDNKRQIIYLGALLHDIGKFYQRADKNFFDKYNELSGYSKNLANDICPINDSNRFGYQHVIWTNEFFEKFREKFESIPGVRNNLYSESDIDNLINFACNHHKPQSRKQALISLADGWSAGIDRIDAKNLKKIDYGAKKLNWEKNRHKTIPLYSIFNDINNGKYDNAFKLKSLNIESETDIFTDKIEEIDNGISQEKYKELWQKFISEFDNIPTDDISAFTESLFYLLKKYTWCIPSNTMDMANVSLFEHLKTTAAFADCLYVYSEKHHNDFIFDDVNKRLKIKNGKYPVILFGGDISGIQKFIYNIASNKAAKSLKGRSFYLQLLIDSIIQQIITHKDIKATIGHVIYSSGGKFYMALPNTQEVIYALDEIKNKIEEELWKEHKGKLAVNFAYLPFTYRSKKENNKWVNWIETPETNERNNLGGLWKLIADKLIEQKNQKFKSVIINKTTFFDVQKTGGDVAICAVTGEELDKNNRIEQKDIDYYVSKTVAKQTELGTALKDADYLITYKNPKDESKYLNNYSHSQMNIVGIDNYLFDKIELIKENVEFRSISSADVSRVIKFNNTDFIFGLKGKSVSYGFQFYGGNEQACLRDVMGNIIFSTITKNGIKFCKKKEKTFEDIAKNDKGKQTYLGILRMDIDGLGNIFIKGIPENQKSFAAYATMSFQLDLFFSGYLNTIRNSKKYNDWVNILYSGGDDIFAIGRWDKIIEFAEKIQLEFKRFIGRDDITISAGIAIVRNKFPIAKAADLAGVAEEQSKNYPDNLPANKKLKNAITFLGETISWKEDFNKVKKLKNDFVKKIKDNKMSHSILHKLMQFAEIKKTNIRKQKENKNFIPDLSYKWNTAYYLKRFMERYKSNKVIINEKDKNNMEISIFIKNIQKDLFVNNNYEYTALACRWAELELREIIKDNSEVSK